MKVLFLATHLNTGGITSYLLTLSKGFVKRGIEVHIISSGGNMEDVFLSVGAKLQTMDIRTKSELSPKLYRAINPIRQYIKEHQIDVIHSHTRITQVMGAMLRKLTGCAYVSTCHGFFKTRLSRRLVPCWGQSVIAISEVVHKHLTNDFKVHKNQVSFIKSGIDLDDFKVIEMEEKKKLRQKFNLTDEPVIGMVARLSDVKGQDILVEAMTEIVKKVPRAKLLLVGEGKLEPLLHEMVENLDLENHVLFYPIVDRTSDMLGLLDIFINPSRAEGLGLSVMEAQAAGVPVVASDVGGIPSLIKDGKTGVLVESENPSALAKAIVSLLNDEEKQKNLGVNARKQAEEDYSSDVMIDEILKVYEKHTRR